MSVLVVTLFLFIIIYFILLFLVAVKEYFPLFSRVINSNYDSFV